MQEQKSEVGKTSLFLCFLNKIDGFRRDNLLTNYNVFVILGNKTQNIRYFFSRLLF